MASFVNEDRMEQEASITSGQSRPSVTPDRRGDSVTKKEIVKTISEEVDLT